jgi:predicted Fe-S protein YdhL (DUF1289 family)
VTPSPASPCRNVCVLDSSRTCIGCLRTLDEIARWGRMSDVEKRLVLARLDESRRLRDRTQPEGAAEA